MDSAIDHCLDELRRAFEDIDHWIHVPVFEFLVNIPEGNENDLYDLAGKYNDAALLHAGHAQDISAHINDLYTSWSGDGAAQAAQSSLQQYMQQMTLTTEAFQDMEGLVSQGAQDIESTKYMAILNLVMLLVTLIQVIMTLWCTFGATAAEGAGAIALCRQALITALRQLLEKLGSITVRGLAKLALKRGLQFAAFTALSKGGIYLIESGEGHNPTWDWKSFSGEMLDSFTTGFIGGPLSFGLRGPLAESVAMAGGQVGDNAFRKWRSELLGDSQWAKDWGLYQDPSTISLMDGVAQAGIFGAAMGAGGMKDRMPDLLGKVKADMDLAKLGDLGRLGEIDPLIERPALEPVGARADALSDTPAGTRSDARADDGRTGDVRADDARSADRQTDPSGGSHADEPTGRADAGDARPGEHGNDPVASANGHRDDAAVPAAGDGHPTSADPASDHPTTDGTGNTTHHTSDANGATGHDATGATGHDPGTAGDGTTADHSSGGSNADHARDQARFYEWKKRFEGRQTEAYDKQLASGLLEHDGKPPVRLTHDMASRVLDHRPEDLSPFGRRLHSFVEQHFTEVREDGTRLILDDAAIQATLADLGRAAETRAAPVGRSEPVRDDAREPADGTAERWVSADSRSELSNPLDHGRMLFGEVLDREFGEGWDRSSPENLARITDMVSQVLDTPRNALSDAHEGRMLRDFVVDKLTRAEDGAMSRTPLDATAMRERLREFYPETEREPVSAPDHEGRDHQPVDSRRPDEHGPDHRTPGHQTPDHRTPDHQIPDHHGSDARTSDGDGDGDRGTARPRPTGPADVITSDPVTHTFLSRDPTPERPGFIRTNVVERTRFEMGFERFPVEELPGGVDSPEARAATHDAARMLVAEMHQREVAAMHEWLVDGKRPAETDMVRIGQTATAVMLKDGTLVAASSVRETRLSTATTEVRYGDPLPADLRPAGALDARDVVGHRVVADALDSVPENQRSLFHGRCGEPTVLSKLANTLEEPYRRDYLERAGVESLADLSPDRLAEYHRDFESYLRDRLDGGNIESHYSGGPDQGGEQFPCASDDLLIESFGLRSEYVDRLASEAYVDPEHGVVSLLAADDPLRANASALASAHPDWLVVVTHGRLGADSFLATFGDRQVELSHVEVARLIRTITADNDALAGRTKILLLSCDAGASFTTRGGETTFASQLATRLSTEVVSPTDTVWISDRGAVRVGEHSPRITYEGTSPRRPDTPDWVRAGADGTVSHGDVDGLLGRNDDNAAHLSGEHWDSASAGDPGDINWHPEFPKTLPDDHPLLTPTDQIHTPEREALRDQIVQDVLGEAEPVTEGKPTMYAMGGGGASGKGFVLRRLVNSGEVPSENVVHLDPDGLKERIPEYGRIVAAGDSRAAAVVHEESSGLAKRILAGALERKLNIVYDVTLGDPRKAIDLLQRVHDAGYQVRLYGVSADAETALQRNISRAAETGRYVPIDMQLSAHRGFSEGFEAYADIADYAVLYDTNGEVNVLMAVKLEGRPLEIADYDRFEAFEHKRDLNVHPTDRADLYREPEPIEAPDTPPDRDRYVADGMSNLARTSRTAGGTVDTSASAGKADQMAAGLSGDRAAELAQENYRSVLNSLYEQRHAEFDTPADLRRFVEDVVKHVNSGITRDGVLYREHDSEKYPSYTRVAELDAATGRFFGELYRRLTDPAADPVETAAWVEYRMDLTDHLWADGCGKTAKAIAAWVLMRSGYPLPDYPALRAEQFAHAPRLPSAAGPGIDAVQFREWLRYYRSLFGATS